jgi:hypothetical protein
MQEEGGREDRVEAGAEWGGEADVDQERRGGEADKGGAFNRNRSGAGGIDVGEG